MAERDRSNERDDEPQGLRTGRSGLVDGRHGVPAEFVDTPANQPGEHDDERPVAGPGSRAEDEADDLEERGPGS